MSKLGVGIVGCGWVAEEYIKAFTGDERSEVRALVSRSQAKPEGYRDKYALDCLVTADQHEMLAKDDIDIVVVSTPHDQHTDYVVAAAGGWPAGCPPRGRDHALYLRPHRP